jgi:hypothetical protein
MRHLFTAALIGWATLAHAAPPATCNIGALYYDITSTTTVAMYVCTSLNTWSTVGGSAAALPTGAIIFVASSSQRQCRHDGRKR